ncbi:hypothetical protein tinsulaeT_20670 [Thalassotalea insulae]|uniref:Uncharacterized protein n=1 Tax=Thalassotalea insulae TaxID=2056778 RepID=A0ABQ6GTP6_9GAMM|nr:hypothetical protein [Thalassotalea insulae]GLX78727.1 hypothetical protein tinsulaeT_20670 [Thalassotalea insulae]
MKNTLLAFTLSAFSALSFASSHISYLNVENDTVVFSLSEAKSHTIPSCVSSENQQKYAVSLTSETGRAVYSLLITAMASKQGIAVESANDCAVVSGIEQAMGVSIVPEVKTTGDSKALYLYKNDGVTKLGRILNTTDNINSFWYFPIDDPTQVLKYNNRALLTLTTDYTVHFMNENCTGAMFIQYVNSSTPNYVKNRYIDDGGLMFGSSSSYQTLKSSMHADGSCQTNTLGQIRYRLMTLKEDPLCGNGPCLFKED